MSMEASPTKSPLKKRNFLDFDFIDTNNNDEQNK